jgi:cytosine/adenosine deaminase-related metal-dependent hydrolase
MNSPGAVNAHTHLYSGLAPLGMPVPSPPPETFLGILEQVWWRLDRALDPASLRAAARFYAAHALLAGTTAVFDHHESPGFIEGSLDVIADACEGLGLRAVLCYGATERNGGRAEARRGLAECRRFLLDNERPLVRGAVGLHASFTVSDDTIREAGQLARDVGAVVHVHVAEDEADVLDARARGYAGPLQRLLALGALPPGSILAHGVHLSRVEVRRAEDAGLWLVQNPRSNRNNRVGYARALRVSQHVALGTDGFPADMADESEALHLQARAHRDDLVVAAARLPAGRRLLAERFGAVADEVVPAEGGRRARDVTVGGRAVVRDGQLVAGDDAEIAAEAGVQAALLFARMKDL